MQIGTLKELNAKPGDVVQLRVSASESVGPWTVIRADVIPTGQHYAGEVDAFFKEWGGGIFGDELFTLISRAADAPVLWKDMTSEQKGALLLARHEGKSIEILSVLDDNPHWISAVNLWNPKRAYRVKPEPVTVTYLMHCDWDVPYIAQEMSNPTHRITFKTLDGEPDPKSIKMEKVGRKQER